VTVFEWRSGKRPSRIEAAELDLGNSDHEDDVTRDVDTGEVSSLVCIHHVSKKLCKLIFSQNFVKLRPIVIIFGIKIEKSTSFSEVIIFHLTT